LLTQSLATEHALPEPHFAQLAPPQSMSVSVPFLTASVHVAVRQTDEVHTPLTQSLGPAQTLPAAHFGHEPPQSASVSVPFLTASTQLGAWQISPAHTLLAQSLGTKHALPEPHFAQLAPPQSMSVSVPFLTLSPQPGLWQ
jgi:hypothetical protein